MPKTIRMIMIAALIGGLLALVLGLITAVAGVTDGTGIAVFTGGCFAVLCYLSMRGMAGNVNARRLSPAEQTALLAAPPPPGKGAVVVIRRGCVGRKMGMDVALDGQRVAQLKSPACVRIPAPAGPRELSVAMPAAKAAPAAVAVNIAAGDTLFFEAGLKSALKPSLTLATVPDPAAAQRLAEQTPMVAALA